MKTYGLLIVAFLMGLTPILPEINVGDASFNVVPQAKACRRRCGRGHGVRVGVRVRVRHGGFFRPFPIARAIGRGFLRAGRFIGRVALGAWRIATWPFRFAYHYGHHGFHRGFAYGYGGHYGHGFRPYYGGSSVRVRVNVGSRYYF